jgi:AcrR family transcriptional regulator
VPYRYLVATIRTPRKAWVDAGLEALAAGGPDAVRVEALAQSLGVTKGGFYWHFADRPALLLEMLDTWEKAAVEDVIARLESEPAEPRAKLQHLFKLAAAAPEALAVELALRDWARRDRDIAARLQRVDDRRMTYLRSLFAPLCSDEDDVEARSLLVLTLYIGSHFVMAKHGSRSRRQVLARSTDLLLA